MHCTGNYCECIMITRDLRIRLQPQDTMQLLFAATNCGNRKFRGQNLHANTADLHANTVDKTYMLIRFSERVHAIFFSNMVL